MSALAGVFGPAADSSGAAIGSMLAGMHHRASGAPEHFHSSGVALSAARHDWEADVSGWSGPLMASDHEWVVAADASLYYVDDLKRRLRIEQRDIDSAHLLLLALRRWGARFAHYLEGDFSIVAWERRSGRVLMARDFGGRRNLAYAIAGPSLVVASMPTAVVRHPQVSADYDEAFIALSAIGAPSHGTGTAFRSVRAVPGGTTLSFEQGRLVEVQRWTPPPFVSDWEPTLSAQRAEELRSLLQSATRERLDRDRSTTIWMSGGWDSTSVFAAGMSSLGANDRMRRELLPVSISYPAGDAGHEDAWIREVAERWRVPVRWLESGSIPLIADSDRRARLRDDPMVQAFEGTVRALSAASRELQSRVVLDGFGGDHIFHVSSAVIFADHLFYGRWPQLLESWRSWPASKRLFLRNSVLPHLSSTVRDWIGSVRGKPLAGYWDRSIPPWIIPSAGIASHLVPEYERQPGEGAAEYETRKAINTPFVARAISWNHAIGLDEGVQLRSPIFDRRVISFAATNPLSDRGGGGDSKRLLRRSMAGLLPDSLLAARDHKTGLPIGYFRSQFQSVATAEIGRVFGTGRSQLERLGVLNREAFLEAATWYEREGVHSIGALLHLTLEAERWLALRDTQG